jgi:hypothetical protein
MLASRLLADIDAALALPTMLVPRLLADIDVPLALLAIFVVPGARG